MSSILAKNKILGLYNCKKVNHSSNTVGISSYLQPLFYWSTADVFANLCLEIRKYTHIG